MSEIHASDCATHNMPALPAGPCDCGAKIKQGQRNRIACVALVCGMLGACGTTPQPPAAITTTLTTAQADVQKAISLYQIAKGIAEVAELADTTLAPAITAGFAVTNPIVAKAQTALTDASTDAAALEALVAQISAQANTLTVQSAAVVKVVPSAS